MLLLKPWENAPVIGQEMGIMLLLKDQFPRLYKISSSPCALFQIWEIGCMHGSLVLECILTQKLESFRMGSVLGLEYWKGWEVFIQAMYYSDDQVIVSWRPSIHLKDLDLSCLKSKHSVQNRLCTKSFLLGRGILSLEQSVLCKWDRVIIFYCLDIMGKIS
jgi:hypothetical protein